MYAILVFRREVGGGGGYNAGGRVVIVTVSRMAVAKEVSRTGAVSASDGAGGCAASAEDLKRPKHHAIYCRLSTLALKGNNFARSSGFNHLKGAGVCTSA